MIDVPVFALALLLETGLKAVPGVSAWPGHDLYAAWATQPAEGPPAYSAAGRAVSNWRVATRRTLEPAPLALAAGLFGGTRPVVTRCVKLNNPWCIKRAGWTGELGADDEGHTAFASTEAGADAAASLLRTYYVDLDRHSALDIVRRWAPAECRIGAPGGLSAALAVRGLVNTLRARFLSARRRGGTPGPRAGSAPGPRAGRSVRPPPPRIRVSRFPLRAAPAYRVPDIAAGLGERAPASTLRIIRVRPRTSSSGRPAARNRIAASSLRPVPTAASRAVGAVPAPPAAAASCGSEEGRIQYYAQAIAKALGVSPGDDLKLFDTSGLPTANLLPVMVAMSAVELGYLHAGPELVDGSVERLRARLAVATARAADARGLTVPAAASVP